MQIMFRATCVQNFIAIARMTAEISGGGGGGVGRKIPPPQDIHVA